MNGRNRDLASQYRHCRSGAAPVVKPSPWKTGGWSRPTLIFLIVALATVALYAPFLGNAIVFDDHNLFTNLTVYDYATTPFNLAPRNFPYFTLGFTEVTWKSIEAQRVVSLLIHLLNAFVLFRLLGRWLKEIGGLPADKALTAGSIGSLFFAIHPVAVYGAGYLVQRTILLATLFSLLSLWFYWRSLARNRVADAVTAALFYALAIYSKEHAIMLPAAALLLTALHEAPWRQNLTKAMAFAALCLPPAILVVLAVKGVIGTAYEPDSTKFISALSGIPSTDSPGMRWLVSGVTQTGVFFQYLQSWLLPDVRAMSADIRVDFIAGWIPAWIVAKIAAFSAFAAGGVFLLRRGGKRGLVGWGMLFTWLLYATELSSLRFQEPFVLYRSYLWAPGIVLATTAILAGLNTRMLSASTLVVAPLLFLSAQDRLRSMSNDLSVWTDAAEKLPSISLLGSDRIYYNRGTQYLKEKKYREAIADFGKSLQQNPQVSQSYLQRGIAYYSLLDYRQAISNFDRAIALGNAQGLSYYSRAMAWEKLGCTEKAIKDYMHSRSLGSIMAEMALKNLNEIRDQCQESETNKKAEPVDSAL